MRAALVLIMFASCTPHADGSCAWVPGDDGSCDRGGGGCSGIEDPPLRYLNHGAAVAPGHLFVSELDDRLLLYAPLDERGLPTQELATIDYDTLASIRLWPGPDRTALITIGVHRGASAVTMAATIDATGRQTPRITITDADWEQFAVVFDGEAYLVAWLDHFEGSRRLQLQRIWPDGSAETPVTAAFLDERDDIDKLELASDGEGGVAIVWDTHVESPSTARNLWVLTVADGEVVEPARVFASRILAEDVARCVGDRYALLATRDGYRVLATRFGCDVVDEEVIVELQLDGSEVPSTLELPAVPRGFVARRCAEPSASCVEGFLAYDDDEDQAWFISEKLKTATPTTWPARSTLRSVTTTDSGYVAVFAQPETLELVRLTPGMEPAPVTIDEKLHVLNENCSVGGDGSLAPMFVTFGLLVRRRRRRAPRATPTGFEPVLPT